MAADLGSGTQEAMHRLAHPRAAQGVALAKGASTEDGEASSGGSNTAGEA